MRKLILILIIFLVSACAHKPKPERAKLPEGVRQPSSGEIESTGSPQRLASLDLVEQGEAALKQGNLDRATDLFQESVTLDATNGVGYYYLAWIKFQEGEFEESEGYLDRAEVLLSRDPEWSLKVEELRQNLEK